MKEPSIKPKGPEASDGSEAASRPRLTERQLIRLLFVLFLAVGIFARVWKFGTVPGGINQDEAFAAYEAYSLLKTGLDTSGYPFPVYLTAWGSGMNALETYLMMPFVALFGLEAWAIRLPQLIVALLSLVAACDVLKRLAGQWAALCGLFLLAVCPWHIMLARWGLESNLAPGFLLFGLCFFLRGLDKPQYFLLSALMYGLSLYCYATIWPFVPVMLLLQAAYCWRCGLLKPHPLLLGAAGVLFLLALPLLLFVAVNLGGMEEIRLPFLSIPRLLYMRSGEFSLSSLPENAQNLFRILVTQTDGLPWNAMERFGMFYFCTAPFFLLGLFRAVRQTVSALKEKKPALEGLLLIWLAAGLVQGLMISANINRVNLLWMPVVLLSALGIWDLCARLGQRTLVLPLLVYAALFGCFEYYYFTGYANDIAWYFYDGLEEAVEMALDRGGTIYVNADASYARVLFYSAQDPDEYRRTVQYTNYPNAFLDVYSFGRFRFVYDVTDYDPNGIYLTNNAAQAAWLMEAGFQANCVGYYTILY